MLVNFTSGVFKSEKEMELYRFRWNEAQDKYLDDLQANGLTRWASMQIWNKQGKSQLGWLFEYSDPDAYKKCQPIFKQMEADFGDIEMKLTAYRGVVLERICGRASSTPGWSIPTHLGKHIVTHVPVVPI